MATIAAALATCQVSAIVTATFYPFFFFALGILSGLVTKKKVEMDFVITPLLQKDINSLRVSLKDWVSIGVQLISYVHFAIVAKKKKKTNFFCKKKFFFYIVFPLSFTVGYAKRLCTNYLIVY
jgi:hypothetical protein